MKRSTTPLSLLVCASLHGQVEVSKTIRFTGAEVDRRIEGVAEPVQENAAITVAVLASGMAHWAGATLSGDTVVLSMAPPVEQLTNGLLVRFAAPTDLDTLRWIAIDGHAARAAVRHDGALLDHGAIKPGAVAEALYTGAAWVVLNANHRTCPPGSISTSGPVCMDTAAVPGLRFYQAIEYCATRGGKLCTWDEYAVGCALRQGELTGLFNEWEWIDDSSNHTHTANQAGRFTCQSQRSANVVTLMTGDTRCCYQTR